METTRTIDQRHLLCPCTPPPQHCSFFTDKALRKNLTPHTILSVSECSQPKERPISSQGQRALPSSQHPQNCFFVLPLGSPEGTITSSPMDEAKCSAPTQHRAGAALQRSKMQHHEMEELSLDPKWKVRCKPSENHHAWDTACKGAEQHSNLQGWEHSTQC